jgi:hypothetical protein
LKTITLTDEQYQALTNGESITIEPPKKPIVKWNPKGGEYFIDLEVNSIYYGANPAFTYNTSKAGLEYGTLKAAENALRAIRSYARQLAWLDENDDGWRADWNDFNQEKYCVYYNQRDKVYSKTYYKLPRYFFSIHMSRENSEKLVKLLNSGEVEF